MQLEFLFYKEKEFYFAQSGLFKTQMGEETCSSNQYSYDEIWRENFLLEVGTSGHWPQQPWVEDGSFFNLIKD